MERIYHDSGDTPEFMSEEALLIKTGMTEREARAEGLIK